MPARGHQLHTADANRVRTIVGVERDHSAVGCRRLVKANGLLHALVAPRIDAGARTATTRPFAHTASCAESVTSTMTFRSVASTGCASISNSGPRGVGRRKSTWSDAVTKRGVASRP